MDGSILDRSRPVDKFSQQLKVRYFGKAAELVVAPPHFIIDSGNNVTLVWAINQDLFEYRVQHTDGTKFTHISRFFKFEDEWYFEHMHQAPTIVDRPSAIKKILAKYHEHIVERYLCG